MRHHFNDFLYNTLLLGLGSVIYAVAVDGFLIPRGFLSRGITRVALINDYDGYQSNDMTIKEERLPSIFLDVEF